MSATPNQPWNVTLGPGESTESVGFCAQGSVRGAIALITRVTESP